ncbi:MAG: hypothetical protein DHS20C15_13180 [Planctomycetota bacterium]|nr:MAG: hypothetical protein DHS20C15_13180 [Planctomycetota bacterium]
MSSPEDRAEQLFAEWLDERDANPSADFEALLAAHPELARELSDCHSGWALLEGADSGLPEPLPPEEHLELGMLGESRLPGARRVPLDERPTVGPGSVVGDFKLLRALGQGGMGQVWEAEQVSLGRRVALKLLRPGREHAGNAQRLEQEARAAGRADHPGLVVVYATGIDAGHRYIAQQLVGDGHNLADLIDRLRDQPQLGPDDYRKIAVLFRDVARAVHAAHEAGVLHRDLKPQNILIDHDERPRVSDFGLAHLDEGGDAARPGLIGTYAYMSPEQTNESSQDIDQRSDVFGLGAVFYEALTQRRAFDGDTPEQILRQLRDSDPPDPRRIRSRVPADLAIISSTALQKSRAKRYASMAEFADDLQRFLDHQPIHARPQKLLVRLGKWSLRHPGQSTGLALGTLALLVISAFFVREVGLRRTAQTEKARADKLAEQAQAAEQLAEQRSAELLRQSYVANVLAATTHVERAEFAAARARLAACAPELRAWEHAELSLRADSSLAHLLDHDGEVTAVALSVDGTRAYTAGVDGQLLVWSGDESATARPLLNGAEDFTAFTALAASPTHLAAGTTDGRVLLLDAESGEQLHAWSAHVGGVSALAFTDEGARLASAGADGSWNLREVATGTELQRVANSTAGLASMALDGSGELLATLSRQGILELWETADGTRRHTLAWYGPHLTLVMSRDGTQLWAGTRDGVVELWDTVNGERVRSLRAHEHGVTQLALSADGLSLLTGSAPDNSVRLWEADSLLRRAELSGHDGPLRALALSADASRALAGSARGGAVLWDGQTGDFGVTRLAPGNAITSLASDADGRRVLSASINERSAHLWDGESARVLAVLTGHGSGVTDLDLSGDGQLAVTGSYDGTVRVWSGHDGRALNVLRGHGTGVTAVALDEHGDSLAVSSYDGKVRLWAPRRGEQQHVLDTGPGPVTDLALSANGRDVLVARADGSVQFWRDGARVHVLQSHDPLGEGSVTLSSDGRVAAWAGLDGDMLRVWNTDRGERLTEIRGFGSGVVSLAMSGDGRRLLTATSGDATLRLWDSDTGSLLMQLREHGDDLSAVAFSDDGRVLISSARDGGLRLWFSELERARALWLSASPAQADPTLPR